MFSHCLRPRLIAPVTLILLAGALGSAGMRAATANSLLVSDVTHVLAYDASSGVSQGVFISSGTGGITSAAFTTAGRGVGTCGRS